MGIWERHQHKRVAVPLPSTLTARCASRLGVAIEKKRASTHYIHLRDQQLLDPRLAAAAVEAAVTALTEMSMRNQGLVQRVRTPPARLPRGAPTIPGTDSTQTARARRKVATKSDQALRS